jgi:hypothetical protein
MSVVLSTVGDFYVFNQKEPARFVTKLTGYVENVSGSGTVKREFRWNTNDRVRTPWIELTDTNLQAVILDPNYQLFLDFRYTLVSGGPFSIQSINVVFEQSSLALDPYLGYFPPLTVADKGNITNMTKIDNFTFKPYQVNPAVVLYKDLSYTMMKLFGHDVTYARAVPLERGKDVVLHEWTLYDVDEPICAKVLVPNNEFPDSKINFNTFGLDFEMPFEVHVDKAYFEELFGVGNAPQKRDIIYFPLENRIYEIDSSYLFKDIMRREVYWKVNLMKYSPKSNRYEPDRYDPQDLRSALDTISADTEELFGEEVFDQEIKLTKPQQYDPKIGSRDYDPTRLDINNDLIISLGKIENHSILISESQYDLRSITEVKEGLQPVAVTYREKASFPANGERSLLAWFKPTPSKLNLPKDKVQSRLTKGTAGDTHTPVSFLLSVSRTFDSPTDVYLKITRFNGITLYGYLTGNPTAQGNYYSYTIMVPNAVVSYLDAGYPNWAAASISSGYVAEQTFEKFFIDGFDTTNLNGWKASIFADRYITFTYYVNLEPVTLIFSMNNNLEEAWHAMVLNISNYYKLVSLDVWKINDEPNFGTSSTNTNLENIYSYTFTGVSAVNRSSNKNYEVRGADMSLTNIRLFDDILTDQDQQIIVLNQAIVQDAQLAIIIDNAKQRLTLPWIANSK